VNIALNVPANAKNTRYHIIIHALCCFAWNTVMVRSCYMTSIPKSQCFIWFLYYWGHYMIRNYSEHGCPLHESVVSWGSHGELLPSLPGFSNILSLSKLSVNSWNYSLWCAESLYLMQSHLLLLVTSWAKKSYSESHIPCLCLQLFSSCFPLVFQRFSY
jgi:hypothetical protein